MCNDFVRVMLSHSLKPVCVSIVFITGLNETFDCVGVDFFERRDIEQPFTFSICAPKFTLFTDEWPSALPHNSKHVAATRSLSHSV